MHIELIAGESDRWVDQLAEALPGTATPVLVVRISAGSATPFVDWVVRAARDILLALESIEQQARHRAERVRPVIVVSAAGGVAGADLSARAALVQACRGIAQSITEEQPRGIAAVNVITHSGHDVDDVVATLTYLESDLGLNTAGSWIGLDQNAWSAMAGHH